MKKSRFTEVQIVGVLQEHEKGAKVADLCRRHGITETTFYRWKKKYGGLQVSEAKRLRSLKKENRQLKRLVADQALNLQVVNDLLGKSGDARATADGCHECSGDRRDLGALRLPLHGLCALEPALCLASAVAGGAPRAPQGPRQPATAP